MSGRHDEGDFASNLPARQKDSSRSALPFSFLHFTSDFIVHSVAREGLLSPPPSSLSLSHLGQGRQSTCFVHLCVSIRMH